MKNIITTRRCFLGKLVLAGVALSAAAQEAPRIVELPRPKRTFPVPDEDNDEEWISIFDGKTLAGWEGDPAYWRVEDGLMVGEITQQNLLKDRNSFLTWRGGIIKNAEIKVKFRITLDGNSGVSFRNLVAPGIDYGMTGMQADIDGKNLYNGCNWEERGRTNLALRGQVTNLRTGKLPQIIGSCGTADELGKHFKPGDWNDYHIIARGNVFILLLNKQVMSIVIDDDPVGHRAEGLLGVQVHMGPPMKIEYRQWRLRQLP